ncbi:hypothetical protein Scep_025990 [Stephania cephalantha]|uniref:Sister chromatid cohesion protein DCC1 n=1 Tax=Stephania cephalantha TaxID=152367 RepID=A0AAP0EJ98_9MAGN
MGRGDGGDEMWRGGAEAVLDLQPNSSISITYDTFFGAPSDLLLLELDDKLLPQILQNRVTIRGEPDEEAVLCTPAVTYALKYVGTSNSVFLIPPSGPSSNVSDPSPVKVASVIKLAPGVMELVEVAPRLDKLKELLAENPYRPEEDSMEELEENDGLRRLRWEDLVERVQASDEELKDALKDNSAVEINGYWRIVDEKYMDMVLNMLLHNLVLNEWSLEGFEEDQVLGIMGSDGFPLKIVLHCLEVYGRRVNLNDELSGGSCLWRLDEKQVCVHFARVILCGGKMKMERFMEEWMDKIPAGMSAGFEMLEGEVLVENIGVETWIWAFRVSSLPSTPAERFAALFQARQKWEWKDLQPYIRDLRVPGLSSESLLLKYTRRTQPTMDAEPVFSAR